MPPVLHRVRDFVSDKVRRRAQMLVLIALQVSRRDENVPPESNPVNRQKFSQHARAAPRVNLNLRQNELFVTEMLAKKSLKLPVRIDGKLHKLNSKQRKKFIRVHLRFHSLHVLYLLADFLNLAFYRQTIFFDGQIVRFR